MATAIWNPATVYILNDVVEYAGVNYISIQTGNVNNIPSSSPLWWGASGAGGVTSIIAGTGITVSGSSAVTITNAGVRTLTAGTGITLGGTANAPIVNAVSNGPIQSTVIVVPPTGASPSSTTITAAQISNLYICTNTSAGQRVANIYVPTAAQMVAQFGTNAVIEWYIGALNITIYDPSFPGIAINVNTSAADSNSAWCTNNQSVSAPPQNLTTKLYALLGLVFPTNSALLPNGIYKVLVTIQNSNVFYFFDYRGSA